MKKLTIEQKAQRYDEAIKVAKDIRNGKATYIPDGTPVIEALFPELKEPEDERIRKSLIDMLKNDEKHYLKEIAWLEKQVPTNEEAEKEKNDYVSGQFLYCKGSFNEFKEGESYWIEYIGNDTYIGRSDNILNQKFHITPRQLYTWLDPRHPEKQGEQKQEANYPKFDFNDILALQCCMETVKKVQEDKELYGQLQSLHDRLYDAYRLEKQGKKKFIDDLTQQEAMDIAVAKCFEQSEQKLEPKFHKGEWITNGDYTWKIVEVKPLDYILQSQDGNIVDDTIFHVDEQFHSFTIEDAKDGDVLIDNYNNVVIYQEPYSNLLYHSFCFASTKVFVDSGGSHFIEGTYPATKEQRDLLFQKMKEAGYEWDAEKKELRKIVTPKFNVHDCIIKKHNSNINDFDSFIITDITGGKYWYNYRIICDISEQDEWELYEPVRQNTAEWSEEDEYILGEVITHLEEYIKLDKENYSGEDVEIMVLENTQIFIQQPKNSVTSYSQR